MSWGERSCKFYGQCPCPDQCTMSTCNVDCTEYDWDKKTAPDSKPKQGAQTCGD